MQFTNAQTNAWKRIPFIAAACAAVAAAVLASGILQDTSMPMPAVTSDPPAPSISRAVPQPAIRASATHVPTYIYVVGSEEEALALRLAFFDAATEGDDAATRHIFVVDSPEDEAALQNMDQELYSATNGQLNLVTLVDLRSPPTVVKERAIAALSFCVSAGSRSAPSALP
jgi:hypothetical protein